MQIVNDLLRIPDRRRLVAARKQLARTGRTRALHDNIFVERLWWTVKHEWVYLRPAANGIEQKRSLAEFFDWYNPASSRPSLYAIEEKRFC